MFFSGQLLDSYSKHLKLLSPMPITDLTGEEAAPQEKQRVTVAGMITGVTLKNTKSGERMAFFRLEDQYGEIECVVFARQFAESAHLVRTDLAVAVTGTVSLREDEPPKILVNRMEELTDNASFREPTEKAPAPPPARSAEGQGTPPAVSSTAPTTPVPQHPKRLFLRVPDRTGPIWVKAHALAEIFDGPFPLAIYDASTKQYDFSHAGLTLDDYVLKQFRDLLGDENVILK